MYLDPVAHAFHHEAEVHAEAARWTAADEAAEAERERKIADYTLKLLNDPARMTDVLYQAMANADASADKVCKTAAGLLINMSFGIDVRWELAHLLRALAKEEAGDVLPFERAEDYL